MMVRLACGMFCMFEVVVTSVINPQLDDYYVLSHLDFGTMF